LEDDIAKMIDNELYRLHHKNELDNVKKEHDKEVMSVGLPQGFDFNADFGEVDDSMQMRKDRRLAGRDPAAYCADRCVSTGNCDIFEDFFELSPQEVLKFCKDCVLSEEEEPCEVPESVYGKYIDGLHP
jgi:hypothetical protein